MSAFIPQPNFIVPTAPAGDSSNRAASTEFVQTATAGGGRIAFRAQLLTTQLGLASGTFTILQMATTIFNYGSYFNTTTFMFTPPAGIVQFSSGCYQSNILGSSFGILSIHKNQTRFAEGLASNNAVSVVGAQVVSVTDYANGTDTYDIRSFNFAAATTFTVNGGGINDVLTFFSGSYLGSV